MSYRHHADMQTTTAQPMSLAAAYRHCLDIAQAHYENFPTASKLLRAELRPAVAAIYAFARHADDLADEGSAEPETRIKQLDAWETLLERCVEDATIDHPVFLALGDVIRTYHLDMDELSHLLVAFRMDVSIDGYASLDELRFYCRHSANPIGRLMLQLHGIEDRRAIYYSDQICTALQLINFWQDLSIDLPRGRCYIPEEWFLQAGISREQLLDGSFETADFDHLVHDCVRQSRTILDSGAPLLSMLPLRLRLQIAATLHGGRAILSNIEHLEQPRYERSTLDRKAWILALLPMLRDTLLPPRPASA